MSLRIGDNFLYLGKKFLDSRESFDTLQEMYTCTDVPEGFITYCKEDEKRYEFKNNEWIEFVVSGENVSVDLEDYATKDYVDSAIEEIDITDQLEDYATKNYVTTEIAKAQLSGDGEINLDGFATKEDIPTKTSQLINDSGYITSIPSEYITETELNERLEDIDVNVDVDLSNYATKDDVSEVSNRLDEHNHDDKYLTSVPSEYITETELNEVIGSIDYDSMLGFNTSEIVFNVSSDNNEETSAILEKGILNKLILNNSGEDLVTIQDMSAEYVKQNFAPYQVLKAEHLNYIEDGIMDLIQRVQELEKGGNITPSPDRTLVSINVRYTGGDVIVGTSCNALFGIIVTAYYSDSSAEIVTDYTLSGEINEGANIILVTYEGKMATFTVTGYKVTINNIVAIYSGGEVLTGTNVNDLKDSLTVIANYSNGQSSELDSSVYTLSGEIVEGTSTITVLYEGVTTTFNVTGFKLTLTKISAIYNGGEVATNTDVNELKSNLVVTATYNTGLIQILDSSAYTLSGEIIEGTNIITVSYEDMTATFGVVGVVVLIGLSTMYDGTALDVGSSVNSIQNLSVMGTYSDGSMELIDDYTLSGNNIVEGNNVITISSRGKQTTLNVNGVGNIDPNVVDLVLFTGQSNMSGRGVATDAPIVPTGQGYWYKNTNLTNMSNDTEGLYDIKEPFGIESMCTGSMVSAFALSYYKQTRVPIVACGGAIGGLDIASFLKGTVVYGQYITRSVNGAKAYLESQGKTIRRMFVLFNQGETDAQKHNTGEYYKEKINEFWSDLKADFGFQDMHIIHIGQHRDGTYDFTEIRNATVEFANANNDVTIVSDKFKGALSYMRDEWHYYQVPYNAVGRDSAMNIVRHYNGIEPTLNTFTGLDTTDKPIVQVGVLDDWDYTLEGGSVILNKYIGTKTDVFVYTYYIQNGQFYKSVLKTVETKTSSGTTVPVEDTLSPFANNTSITSVAFEDDTEVQSNNANCMFYGCTALKTISNIPNARGGASSLCYGCTSLQSFPTFAKYGGNFNQAFRNCQKMQGDSTTIIFPPESYRFGNCFRDCKAITSFGDIPSKCEEATQMFQGCTSLVSVGDIGLSAGTLFTSVFYGCTALKSVGTITGTTIQSIASTFQNCKVLEGEIVFESPNIKTVTNVFSNVDLTKVTIKVPADSTTYTTIITAYPNANIVTF